MAKNTRARVDMSMSASALLEMEQISRRLTAAGMCDAFVGTFSFMLGNLTRRLGHGDAAELLDRWVAVLRVIDGGVTVTTEGPEVGP